MIVVDSSTGVFDLKFLSKMVLNIPHVELNASTLTLSKMGVFAGFHLLEDILDGVSRTSVLRAINLGNCHIDHLSVSRIVKLNCLSEVSMESAYMTEEQARAFMVEMGKGSTIKKFDIGNESILDEMTCEDLIENMEPEIVAKALNNVEYLRYNKIADLTEDRRSFRNIRNICRHMEPDTHLAIFLEEMGDKATSLKRLDMEENNYYHVVPSVMAKAFNKLEYLELKPNPSIKTKQIVAILKQMAKQTKIVHLKIIYEDISWLSPDLVARAVVQVEQVDLMCKVSRAHVRAVLSQLDNSSRTRRLNMGTNDVSKIPGKAFKNAVEVLSKNGGSVIVTQCQSKKYLSYSCLAPSVNTELPTTLEASKVPYPHLDLPDTPEYLFFDKIVFTPSSHLLSEMVDKGITEMVATKALYWTGNSSINLACNWIFDRSEDTFETPLMVEIEMLKSDLDIKEEEVRERIKSIDSDICMMGDDD